MYGVVISLILLFPWALVALATVGHLRSRRVPFQLDASRSNGMPPYGMGPHAKALERDAPNGRGDPPGRPYETAIVATARNGRLAIQSWNGTSLPSSTKA